MTFRDFVFTENLDLQSHISNYQALHYLALVHHDPSQLPLAKVRISQE